MICPCCGQIGGFGRKRGRDQFPRMLEAMRRTRGIPHGLLVTPQQTFGRHEAGDESQVSVIVLDQGLQAGVEECDDRGGLTSGRRGPSLWLKAGMEPGSGRCRTAGGGAFTGSARTRE
jgi:hypothetical protein